MLYRDVAPRNMIVTPMADGDHAGFDVKLLDFEHSQTFYGPVPHEEREAELDKIEKIFS